jgi:murein DD-endopeptidase MepM/ murein hydrolase activator NlpD
MRFLIGATLLLVMMAPASANADEAPPVLGYETHPLICAPQFDAVSVVTKATLLADQQAGQLIEAGETLALDGPRSANSSASAAMEPPCNATTPLVAGPAEPIAMALRMPLRAGRTTSGFGMRIHPLLGGIRMHSGIDIAAPLGSPIFAMDSGTVGTAGWKGGYGLFVALEHSHGVQTRYGHMSRVNVVAGQQVQQGDIIGFVGSTGRSTGPHLHYEVRSAGQAINPVAQIAQRGARSYISAR